MTTTDDRPRRVLEPRTVTPTVPAGATRDALGKLPHLVVHEVVTDETAALGYMLARAALEKRTSELSASLGRRLALARHGLPADASDADRERAEDAVHVADDAELAALEERLADAILAWDEARLRFTIVGVGRTRWEKLMTDNPPSRREKEQWRLAGLPGAPQYDSIRVCAALLREAVLDPVLTDEQIEAIVNGSSWNGQEFAALYSALLAAQTQARSTDRDSRPVLVAQDGR